MQRLLIVVITCLFLLMAMSVTRAQQASDVFPAVVFLQGNRGIKHIKIDGRDVEVWIKDPKEDSPQPLKLTSTGTGFIVVRNSRLYLVTAQHVAASIQFDAKATLRGLNDEPLTFPMSQLTQGRSIQWIYHHEADVAVLPITPPQSFNAAIKAVGFDQISTRNSAPELDLFLTTLGFPLQLGVRGKFSPIVKVSHPASAFFRHRRFDNGVEATFFILDDPSVAGFSGAPVFRLPSVRIGVMASGQGPFECVGLVHGTFNDPTGGKFAAIVPAKFVAETIALAASK